MQTFYTLTSYPPFLKSFKRNHSYFQKVSTPKRIFFLHYSFTPTIFSFSGLTVNRFRFLYLTPGLAAASVTDAIEEIEAENDENEETDKKEEKLELVSSLSTMSKKSKNK